MNFDWETALSLYASHTKFRYDRPWTPGDLPPFSETTLISDLQFLESEGGWVGFRIATDDSAYFYGVMRVRVSPIGPFGNPEILDIAWNTEVGEGISAAEAIPEPSTVALISLALAVFGFAMRRRASR